MLESFKRLKQFLPRAKTIVGGPFTLVFPEIIQNNQIDFVIRGDGEYSLPLFFKLYKKRESLKSVPGICYLENDSTLYRNDNIRLTSDLKNLPDPDRDLYYKYDDLRKKETKIFITSRGCPYNCTYCYNAELKKFYKDSYWRLRDPEAVFREIEYVRDKYGLKWAHIQDGTFNSDRDWVSSFLIEYKKRNLPPFLCNCRPENIDEGLVVLMKEAGCERITFGIQSGNQMIRHKLAGRHMSDEQIEYAFELCHRYNIRVGADVIFGWPGETLDQAMDTIRLCRKIKADTYHSNVLIPYPGLFLTREAIKEGYMDHEPSLEEISKLTSNSSLIKQNNIKQLINMDKLFYYMIKLPRLEAIFRLLLRIPPNRVFNIFKNLHLLRRSLKYDSVGLISSLGLIKRYIKYHKNV